MLRASAILIALAAAVSPATSEVTIPIPGRSDAAYVLYDTHLSANFVQTHVRFTDGYGSQHEVWAFECLDGWSSLLHREAEAPFEFPLSYPPRADERLRSDTTIYSIARVSCQSNGFDTSTWEH